MVTLRQHGEDGDRIIKIMIINRMRSHSPLHSAPQKTAAHGSPYAISVRTTSPRRAPALRPTRRYTPQSAQGAGSIKPTVPHSARRVAALGRVTADLTPHERVLSQIALPPALPVCAPRGRPRATPVTSPKICRAWPGPGV